MLKISTKTLRDGVTLVLEGSLSGPWVAEVESFLHRTSIGRTSGRVRVDLSEVTVVGDEGKRLLEQICTSDVGIISSDLLTKALADQLSHKHLGSGNV